MQVENKETAVLIKGSEGVKLSAPATVDETISRTNIHRKWRRLYIYPRTRYFDYRIGPREKMGAGPRRIGWSNLAELAQL